MINQTQQSHIDRADTWCKRAEVPTYTHVLQVLAYLEHQARQHGLPANNHAMQRTALVLGHYATLPGLPE